MYHDLHNKSAVQIVSLIFPAYCINLAIYQICMVDNTNMPLVYLDSWRLPIVTRPGYFVMFVCI